jgi:hypothetical protein
MLLLTSIKDSTNFFQYTALTMIKVHESESERRNEAV